MRDAINNLQEHLYSKLESICFPPSDGTLLTTKHRLNELDRINQTLLPEINNIRLSIVGEFPHAKVEVDEMIGKFREAIDKLYFESNALLSPLREIDD